MDLSRVCAPRYTKADEPDGCEQSTYDVVKCGVFGELMCIGRGVPAESSSEGLARRKGWAPHPHLNLQIRQIHQPHPARRDA